MRVYIGLLNSSRCFFGLSPWGWPRWDWSSSNNFARHATVCKYVWPSSFLEAGTSVVHVGFDYVKPTWPADVWSYLFPVRDTHSVSDNIGYVMRQERLPRITIEVFDSWEASRFSGGWLPAQLVSFSLLYECKKICSSPLYIQYMQCCQEFQALCYFMCDLHVCVAKSWLLCLVCPAPTTCSHFTTTVQKEPQTLLCTGFVDQSISRCFLNRPVDQSQSISTSTCPSTYGKIRPISKSTVDPPTRKYGRSWRSMQIHLREITVDIDIDCRSTYGKIRSISMVDTIHSRERSVDMDRQCGLTPKKNDRRSKSTVEAHTDSKNQVTLNIDLATNIS